MADMINFSSYKETHMSAALSISKGTERPFLALYYDVLEEVQPVLSGNEFTVFIAMFRMTAGWHEASAFISYPALAAKTGIKHLDTIARIVKRLIKRGFITLCEETDIRGGKKYALAERFLTPPEIRGVGKNEGNDPPKNYRGTPPRIRGESYKNWGGTPPEIRGQPLDQTSTGEAPPAPKETLKETLKETSKERAVVQASDIQIESKKGEEEKETAWRPQAIEWQTVLEKLEGEVSKATFNVWLRPVKAYSCGDRFYIVASTDFHVSHLQRLAWRIKPILETLLAPSIEIILVTQQEYANYEAVAAETRSSA